MIYKYQKNKIPKSLKRFILRNKTVRMQEINYSKNQRKSFLKSTSIIR